MKKKEEEVRVRVSLSDCLGRWKKERSEMEERKE